MKYRSHQQQAETLATNFVNGLINKTRTIALVVPGGGKSWLPVIWAMALPSDWQILWIAPRDNLRDQAEDTATKLGVKVRASHNVTDPFRSFKMCVTTIQCLVKDPDLWIHACRRKKTLVIVDECHHLSVNAAGKMSAWTKAVASLPAAHEFYMTGTLERNNPTEFIHGFEYERVEAGYRLVTEPDIKYTRLDALNPDQGPAIVPVQFEHHDGPVKWDDLKNKTVVEHKLSNVPKADASKAIWTALGTGIATELFERGMQDFSRRGVKCLIVCANQPETRRWAKAAAKYGETAIAISDEPQCSDNIKEFRKGNRIKILVTCQVAYEGLDVPELTHGICLTHIRSKPWIEQMLARLWRYVQGKGCAYWFVPDDPFFNEILHAIQVDTPALIRLPGTGGNGPPGESFYVPLASGTESTRFTTLGEIVETSTGEEEIVATLMKHGLPDTAINEVLRQYRSQQQPVELDLTQSEKERRYKKALDQSKKRAARQYNLDHQELGADVCRVMGCRVAEASIEQLSQGQRYVDTKWPPR